MRNLLLVLLHQSFLVSLVTTSKLKPAHVSPIFGITTGKLSTARTDNITVENVSLKLCGSSIELKVSNRSSDVPGETADHQSHADHGDHEGHGTWNWGPHKDHAQHEEAAKLKRLGTAISFLLMFFMIFLMTIVYLINSSDLQVRIYTYKVLSLILAIFCALLIEKAQHAVLVHGIIEHVRGGHAAHIDSLWLVPITVMWYSSLTFLSFWFDGSHTEIFVWAEGIVTHVVAFSVIELVDEAQEIWAGSVLKKNGPAGLVCYYFAWMPITLCLLLTLHMVMKYVRKSNYFSPGVTQQEKERASGSINAIAETPDDAGIAISGSPVIKRGPDGAAGPSPPNESSDQTPDVHGDTAADSDSSDESSCESIGEDEHEHHEEPWYEIAEECEIEVSAIVCGWLSMIVVWGAIRNCEIVHHDCDLTTGSDDGCLPKSASAHITLLFVILLVISLVLLVSVHRNKKNDQKRLSDAIHAFQLHLTFVFAFLTMTQTRWGVASAKSALSKFEENDSQVDLAIFHSPIWAKCANFMVYWVC